MKKVIRFQCDYCKKTLANKYRMKKHEKECLKNPENRSCYFCKHNDIKQNFCNKLNLALLNREQISWGGDITVEKFFKEVISPDLCNNPEYEKCKACREYYEREDGYKEEYCEVKDIANSVKTYYREGEQYIISKRIFSINNNCFECRKSTTMP